MKAGCGRRKRREGGLPACKDDYEEDGYKLAHEAVRFFLRAVPRAADISAGSGITRRCTTQRRGDLHNGRVA